MAFYINTTGKFLLAAAATYGAAKLYEASQRPRVDEQEHDRMVQWMVHYVRQGDWAGFNRAFDHSNWSHASDEKRRRVWALFSERLSS